ncbi:MAG: hypothetical protein U1E99_10250 [Agitococcus sp.]
MILDPFQAYLAEVKKTGKLKNNELYRLALHNDKRAIKYIPYDEQTAEMALMAVNGSPHSLRFVAPTLRTCSLYELAVRKNANTLLYVPEELKTPELCRLAVVENCNALKYVPMKLRTKELFKLAVTKNSREIYSGFRTIKYLPIQLRDFEIWAYIREVLKISVWLNLSNQGKEAVLKWKNPYYKFFEKTPKFLHTEEMVISILNEQENILLHGLDDSIKSERLCLLAIKNSYTNVRFIPEEMKTESFYKKALAIHGGVWCHLPENIKNINLALLALKNCPVDSFVIVFILRKTPKDYFKLTEFYQLALELCKKAAAVIDSVWSSLPSEFYCEELAIISVKSAKNSYWVLEIFKQIPINLRTKDVCWAAIYKGFFSAERMEIWHNIPEHIKDDEMCRYVLKFGMLLKYIPNKLKTDELYLYALQEKESVAIFYVPEKFQTIEKILVHIPNASPEILEDFLKNPPKNMQSNEFLFQLLRKNYQVFECLNSILNTKEFYEYLIIEKECVEYFHKIPNELKTIDLCWFCIKKDIRLAGYIPSHCVTKDLLMYLISEDAVVPIFKNTPHHLLTQELCDSVIRKSPSYFEYIPGFVAQITV